MLRELPFIRLCLHKLQKSCNGDSLQDAFFRVLTKMVTAILSLSLFEHPEKLRVSSQFLTSDAFRLNNPLTSAINLVLKRGAYVRCPISCLSWLALGTVGHLPREDAHLNFVVPILSCFQGQAVWPTTNQTYRVRRRGYLSLSWHPGSLRHENVIYSIIKGSNPNTAGNALESSHWSPDMRLHWSVTRHALGVLEASLCVTSLPPALYAASAQNIHGEIARAVFADRCSNAPSTRSPISDDRCTLT